jgi:glycogen debranching enzyme
VLKVTLDEQEFLSPYGIRSLSRWHKDHPYIMQFEGKEHRVDYQPAESNSGMFGGNSNWRGPVWLPVNFLLVESLQRFHHFFGDAFTVEFPTGSGRQVTLWEAAGEVSRRVNRIFLGDESGNRPCNCRFQNHDQDPHWRDLVLFYEYFHGDTGAGLGANHQTGWTGLVAKLLEQSGA